MHGEITLSGVEHSNEATATLLSSSVGEGTKATYATALGSWTLWRRARGEPLLLHPDRPGEWEGTLCEFYGVVAYSVGYSPSYCHGMLYAIRRQHRLARIYLDVRDESMPLLSMMRKGHKRRTGASRSYSLLFGTEELAGPSGGGRAEESTSHSASGAAFGPCPRVTS